MLKKFILLFLIFGCVIKTNAQFYSSGQDPNSIHWKQIKTNNFRLVFPEYAEISAQKFAQSIAWAYQNVGKDLDSSTRKLNIILHSEAATSNAMVAWAPARMELFNTPPQDNYAQEWYSQLAIHEFRHAVQIDKLNTGFTKILYYIFGDQITAGVLGLYIPSWLLEGDAVWAETKFSDVGRGRLGSFNYDLKAQILDKKVYNYNKAVLGSYKDYIPNQYVLGYHLVASGNKWYGNDFWANTLDNTARKPFMIVPFSASIKKQSGLNKTEFYKKSLDSLQHFWKQETATTNDFSELVIKSDKKDFTSYNFPHYINDSTLFCLKTGMNDIPRFVQINTNTKKEKIIFTPGYSSFDAVHCVDSVIVWTEFRFDKRWEHRRYSVVMKLDLRNNKATKLSKNSKYFAPNLNADATKIVCIEVSKEDVYSLVILSASDGKLIKRIEMTDFLMLPSWSVDDNFIYATRQLKNGSLDLVKINLTTTEIESILPASKNYISAPIEWNKHILFVAEYSGIPNIYALDINSKKVFKITDVNFKLENAEVKSNQLLFSNYSANGYEIKKLELKEENFLPIENVKNNFYWIVSNDSLKKNKNISELDSIHSMDYESINYSKIGHLFNIHSWGPLKVSSTNIGLNPGINFSSQNLLSTMTTQFGYEYQRAEKANKTYAVLSYLGWYPVIDFRFESAVYPRYYDDTLLFNYRKNSVGMYLSQPLRFNSGKFTQFIQPMLGFSIVNQNNITNEMPIMTSALNLSGSFYAYRIMKTSARDVSYRRGQILSLTAAKGLTTNNVTTNTIFAGKCYFYFPGIGKHHSILTRLEFQRRNIYTGQGIFDHQIDFPRGSYPDDFTYNADFASIDYKLPLLYPDLSLSSLVYIKRIYGGVFYDYMKRDFDNITSFGAELYFELNLLCFVAPFQLGIRYSNTNSTSADARIFEFLFSVNFNEI